MIRIRQPGRIRHFFQAVKLYETPAVMASLVLVSSCRETVRPTLPNTATCGVAATVTPALTSVRVFAYPSAALR
jgi:hypothetical protein